MLLTCIKALFVARPTMGLEEVLKSYQVVKSPHYGLHELRSSLQDLIQAKLLVKQGDSYTWSYNMEVANIKYMDLQMTSDFLKKIDMPESLYVDLELRRRFMEYVVSNDVYDFAIHNFKGDLLLDFMAGLMTINHPCNLVSLLDTEDFPMEKVLQLDADEIMTRVKDDEKQNPTVVEALEFV
jgi:hypothetical protein